MDGRLKRAWREVLLLWERLADMEDRVVENIEEFKNGVLDGLGIVECRNGCPFCEAFFYEETCPLGDCSGVNAPCETDTPYREWKSRISMHSMHDQELARAFYDYLVALHENDSKDDHD